MPSKLVIFVSELSQLISHQPLNITKQLVNSDPFLSVTASYRIEDLRHLPGAPCDICHDIRQDRDKKRTNTKCYEGCLKKISFASKDAFVIRVIFSSGKK